MGAFHLCTGQRVARPFQYGAEAEPLYTIEELCFYMEKYLFLSCESLISRELLQWIKDELKEEELFRVLHRVYLSDQDNFGSILYIFRYSGLYEDEELDSFEKLMEGLRNRTEQERQKMRADLYLDHGKYKSALYIYLDLLQDGNQTQMTEELCGDIYHNAGVVYAKMFLFREAASMFAKACAKRKNCKSKEAYLYALNYIPESDYTDEIMAKMSLDFTSMKSVLDSFSRAVEDPDNYCERTKAASIKFTVDTAGETAALCRGWVRTYERMME